MLDLGGKRSKVKGGDVEHGQCSFSGRASCKKQAKEKNWTFMQTKWTTYYINKNFIPETNPLFVNLLRLHKKNLHLQIGQKDVNFNSDNFLVFRDKHANKN